VSQRIVGYLRVSTKEQGRSGLGLEAQQSALDGFARQHGSTVLASYTEIESGRKNNRPKLAEAIAHAKAARATLVVAKLDRLARNCGFICTLQDTGVDFIACDNPSANTMTVQILAAVAQAEAKAISERTKAALAAYRDRGGKLGTPANLTRDAQTKSRTLATEEASRKANEHNAYLQPIFRQLRDDGLTLQQIADEANRQGLVSSRGKPINQVLVKRLLDRQGE
jgi:DNA invertase Pin-like site-specific DNA recombinase